MYRLILILLFFVSGQVEVFSQSTANTLETEEADTVSTTLPIEIRKGLFTSFYQKNERLSTSLLQDVVVKSPEAVSEMKKARTNFYASVACNTLGAFGISYPVASSLLSGNKLNWKLTGLGVALVGAGIPLSRLYSKHARNAAHIHNRRVGQTRGYKANLQLGWAVGGTGLKLVF